ncbi:MAG: Na(+)/H(+) antiporter subunit D [Planctomycetaceae bacterium]|nr:Na(+)/H(+) antiporter subunit D [Planctomycetaceae bacterium]
MLELIRQFHHLPPGSLLILGALLLPFLQGKARQGWMLLLPVISMLHLVSLPNDMRWETSLMGLSLTPIRVDRLSLVWGYIFHAATLISVIYAIQIRDRLQNSMALIYAGSAIGAVFAGDLLTLFIFWEITALSSVFLVWAGRTADSYGAGMRYLLIQVGSGVLLLAGSILHYQSSQTLAFDGPFALEGGLAIWLIFLSFGIKAAFPLLHCWLPDSYPNATPTGTVFLSIYTTKLAIYALARGFAGTELLIVLGVIMAIFPLLFAAVEDDLRRVLAYSLNNQLGFMVVGVGIGSELSLNGTAGHAVSHILYKGLLFMAVGVVVSQTGTGRASKLGGLFSAMPWTACFCMLGTLGMAAPLFAGYVTKSLILSAVAKEHLAWVWLALLVGSAGVFYVSGIRICYEIFFGPRQTESPPQDAPLNMRIAMGLASVGLIALGLTPTLLFSILPHAVDYDPYSVAHVINQFQLLFFTGLAFAALLKFGLYPISRPSILLDFDWLYRVLIPGLIRKTGGIQSRLLERIRPLQKQVGKQIHQGLEGLFSDQGLLGGSRSTSWMAIWAAILLASYLLLYYQESGKQQPNRPEPAASAPSTTSNGGSFFASQPIVD